MKDNKEKLTKEVEENENVEVEETGLSTIQGFGALGKRTETKCNIYTNITDQKKIFNLDSKVDNLLNDCEGELIRVKEVLIKRYEKPMKEPVIDDETGEILKDKEISILKNELLIEEVQKYLDEKGLYDFINTDSKEFEIKVYFIQERQYKNVVLKENGKEKFIFNLSKDELIELIIN